MESSGPVYAPTSPYEPEFHHDPDPLAPKPRGAAENLLLLWRHRRFLWNVVWITIGVSVIVAFVIPKRYQSTARLVPGESSNTAAMAGLLNKISGGGSGSGLSLDAAGILGVKTPGAFYVEILRSRTVRDNLINRFDLRAHYGKRYYQDARKRLDKATDIEEDKKSGVIALSVTDWDRDLAQKMVRAYIDEMNHLAAELNTSAAHRERQFLEDRLKSAKKDLDQDSLELSQFSSKHSMMDVQQQGKSMMDAAARLQGELIFTESELKGLQEIYSDDNVRVRALKARVAELQGQLKKMVGDYTDPNLASQSGAGGGPYPSMRTLPALGYHYLDLYRRAKIQETLYEFLTQQYELARVQEAKELPIVRVLDDGNYPEKKVSPIRSLIVGLSVFVAFVLACSWVVAKHNWEQLSPRDSRRVLVAEASTEVRALMRKIWKRR
ncbi:MAG TPA: Wzz/FepE/Etk N-terminal domain-containing protein [Candidatus Angelobacter sp.]|nr:Wzz/FepE/Etk N-terminal domain-containing protein [Candidatus Angelobacter sp.]